MNPVDALADFIQRSPTPWHAAENAADRLAGAGFSALDAAATWESVPERGFVVRDGSLVAWSGAPGNAPMRLLGAHTDSPNLRIRPVPDTGSAGFRQLAVEVYGGALVNSWLDRDLVLAGRAAVEDPRAPGGIGHRLFHHHEPLLRVPQLAIHLDREVNEGLKLNKQQHLTPVWGLGKPDVGGFSQFVADAVGVAAEHLLGWDVACADAVEPAVLGRENELLAAPRLDNLASCFGAVEALARTAPVDGPAVIVLFDHEEIGSTSATGAVGNWLAQVLERCAVGSGGSRTGLLESLPASMLLSADMAHATHPNYAERHEPGHWVELGAGPVIKHNANVRYATDSRGAAAFRRAAAAAGAPAQDYSHRGDIPCGSTIGPLAAAGLALETVDVGMAMLSMHSIRELMACADVAPMVDVFTSWLSSHGR
ncbi:MAG: M18 family aminopeptidase [Actinomycetia bacterium]|nr:M18 family aminopeptidase [Actinomycetes bacterium]